MYAVDNDGYTGCPLVSNKSFLITDIDSPTDYNITNDI